MEFDFIKMVYEKIKEKSINWNVSALASPNGILISLGSDSKLIGRIFELISFNILHEIADENGFILKPSDQQTTYPDFTLMKSIEDKSKIAIDIKSTYRTFNKSGNPSKYGFTLGSFASFMRNGTKNIMYPYSEYIKHYVIGFIYTRNELASEGETYELSQLSSIQVPYKDVEVFVQEKYRISGEKPGSGNTENIGSFRTSNMDYLVNGEGPFSVLGLEVFENYWSGYPKFRASQKDYTSLHEYFEWNTRNGKDVESLKRIYTYWKRNHE